MATFEDPESMKSALGGALLLVNTVLPATGLCGGLLLYGAGTLVKPAMTSSTAVPCWTSSMAGWHRAVSIPRSRS